MNLLVTGGAGFIGSNLIHFLLRSGGGKEGFELAAVVNLDKLTYAGNPANLAEVENDPRYTFVRGEIGDAALVAGILRAHRIDAVLNLAAESHVDRSIDDSSDFMETNVVGTHRLLDASLDYFRETGARDFRFLHVSTDEVYGSLGPADPAFRESDRYAPNSPYSASKAAADHLVRAWHHTYGLPVITTNCSNNYGPRQFPEKLIPLLIWKALKGENLPLYGDGGNIRDWLYVEDHCRGLACALRRGVPGEVYHFGGSCEMTNLAVAEALLAAMREDFPEALSGSGGNRIEFVPDRPGHDRRYAVDTAKARREFGWAPRETFESGIRKTIRWYLDRQDWVRGVESGAYRGERLGLG